MSGEKDLDLEMIMEQINELREELKGLKDDYILLVGANDLPLYFGKTNELGGADSFQ